MTMVKPRILIASDFNIGDRAHFALSHEFCRIIGEVDDADLVSPGVDNYIQRYVGSILPAHDNHNVQRDFNRLVNGVRKGLGLKNRPSMQAVDIKEMYDVFVFVAWSPQSLVELSRLKNWRQHCKIAVVYLFELWSRTLEADSRYLRLLDQFDHVFLLHSAAVPHLPRYTAAPCSFLPTAVDCMIAAPYPDQPARVIDVYSIGNRAPALHRQLITMARHRDFFYVYDSLSSTDSRVKEWSEHRLLLANTIKRSRYFIAFNPATLSNQKAAKVSGEQVLPSRLFEGAAGGAVILGTAPQCAEFDQYFDWPDAVIEVSPEAPDIAAVIDDLDAQTHRIETVRHTNAVQCLLRHDWVYRWETILSTIGIDPLPQLQQRKARLGELADAAMAASPGAHGGLTSPRKGGQRSTANLGYPRRASAAEVN